ncbi:MAG: hypothetical protein P8Y67_14380 [Alphaproteobacteria bacterium]
MSKLTRIFYFVLGVGFASIAEPYIQNLGDRGYETLCGGGEALTHGKSALTQAIREKRPELAREARIALEEAARCRIGEAQFLLGLIHCNGIGVKKDVARGRRLLRSAIAREPQWALEIMVNPELCGIKE